MKTRESFDEERCVYVGVESLVCMRSTRQRMHLTAWELKACVIAKVVPINDLKTNNAVTREKAKNFGIRNIECYIIKGSNNRR